MEKWHYRDTRRKILTKYKKVETVESFLKLLRYMFEDIVSTWLIIIPLHQVGRLKILIRHDITTF